jgi:thiol-disulfide isomerase/thioredoxin
MKRGNGLLLLAAGLLIGAGIGIIVLFWSPLIGKQQEAHVPPAVGLEAADFSVSTLSGEMIEMSELRGQPMVLNFWATWCPPCKEEMPLFDAYAKNLAGEVFFLAVDAQEEDAAVQSYVEQSGVSLAIGMDRDGDVADRYFVHSFPVTFFIDEDGIIRAQHIGQLNEKLLVKYLAEIGIEP